MKVRGEFGPVYLFLIFTVSSSFSRKVNTDNTATYRVVVESSFG